METNNVEVNTFISYCAKCCEKNKDSSVGEHLRGESDLDKVDRDRLPTEVTF